jgi:hypothetical protein
LVEKSNRVSYREMQKNKKLEVFIDKEAEGICSTQPGHSSSDQSEPE